MKPRLLDGRVGEGGGQMLRLALVASTLTGLPFRMVHIRAGRRRPGLKRQHLGILDILSRWTGARAEPLAVGATEITFFPGELRSGQMMYDLGTAGALSLVLQSLIPLALHAPGQMMFHLQGGTDVPFSPTLLWIREVYLPWLRGEGTLHLEVLRHGFYPRGGGVVRLTVEPRSGFRPLLDGCTPLKPRALRGISLASEQLKERNVAERQARAARSVLETTGLPVDIRTTYVPARSPGSSITLWMETADGRGAGADALGERGKPAEAVGEEAARKLLEVFRSHTVDVHLADHLLLWLILRGGCLRVPRWTGHLESGVYVLRTFFGEGILWREDLVLQSPGVARGR